MHGAASFLGFLMGNMIDPLTWGSAIIGFMLARRYTFLGRVIVAVAMNLLAATAILLTIKSAQFDIAHRVFFSALGTLVWALIFSGLLHLYSRTNSANAR